MGFDVAADAYDRFMGRYSAPLAPLFSDFAGVDGAGRVLDVGCGPGALTAELVRRLGPGAVVAVDPSTSFVDAVRERQPAIDVHECGAESLPFDDATFDITLAQLVVHFMTDPVGGLREMGRVTRREGVVAACVWDFEEGGRPLTAFWDAARDLDPAAPGEVTLPGTRRGDLDRLFSTAGLLDVRGSRLTAEVHHPTFEDWWEPFELGVGPAGSYATSLVARDRRRLRERCREVLPEPPFTIAATAWTARGRVG